jgi:hypothetical protein
MRLIQILIQKFIKQIITPSKLKAIMLKQVLFFLPLFFCTFSSFSQEKEDETKMIREIVPLEVDRAKYGVKPPPPPPSPVTDVKGKKKKKAEEPVAEPVQDTLPPTMPAPAAEVLKRAQNWYSAKASKFVKANGANSGKTVSCNVSFVFKQKLLNPENEVDGKITMDVLIDAKEGKYRYTIKNIKHKANKQGMSGGDIYSAVPECGSMNVTDRTWKQIKSQALVNAQLVIEDLKTSMKEEVKTDKEEW